MNKSKLKKNVRGINFRADTHSYWFSQTVNKKRTWVNLHTADLADAITRAASWKVGAAAEKDTLAGAIKNFVAHQRDGKYWSRNSAKTKEWTLGSFAASAPTQLNVNAVSATHIAKWLKSTRAAAVTQQGYLMTLSSFFGWAISKRLITHNPALTVTLPKVRPAARKPFCARELRDRLLQNCERADLRLTLYLGFHLGLRRTEIDFARPDWFDPANKICHVKKLTAPQAEARGLDEWDVKDATERRIPMTAELTEFLRAQKMDGDYVLHPEKKLRGDGRYRYDMRRPFGDYMRAQGCAWVTFHTMRHTFASLLASAGVPLYHIAEWLGDDIRTTQKHYASLTPRHDLIERAFSHHTPPSVPSAAASPDAAAPPPP